MNKSDFWYDLPETLIAQDPIEPRDASRLMIVDRKTGALQHQHFYDIIDELRPTDCLVVNDTKVMPARLYGIKEETGAKVEFLLLSAKGGDIWECLCGPGKRAKEGTKFVFGDGLMTAEVLTVLENGNRLVKFCYDGVFYEVLDKIGEMPLPHYITHKLKDKNRYQTVYANETGSAAAPTAGLHFTPELLQKVQEKGVKLARVTLHVGLGTFRPVKEEKIEDHKMHSEYYVVTPEAAAVINATKRSGGRIIAVGTTSCRTLESAANADGMLEAKAENTGIFIYPGYKFKCIDGLITNFHLPESTLVMLVSAFSSREIVLHAYQEAIKAQYRFFSFGDAMFLR
ncbi:MAG: tRNA preQ1(34) S-adenosylmethionine ribosyltransferase-isomerase QueA [Clostridia bacterium]|nr:tRNA preQ1(34) S-adenosylmethionine ribosyltransferase-isomerase QueA [Clostridia bacterium]